MKCDHKDAETRIVRGITSSGHTVVFVQCCRCGRRAVPGALKQKGLSRQYIESLPIAFDNHEETPPCERCGSTDGTEWHHWAPRSVFGDECNEWPTG